MIQDKEKRIIFAPNKVKLSIILTQKEKSMKNLKSIAVALCAAVVMAGCTVSNTVKGTAIGAGDAVKVTFDSGILFTTGSATLSSTAKTSLSQFATVLKNNADCDVAVQGYTDNEGWKNSTREQSQQKNLNLSQQRAQSVTNFLQSLGVSSTQIRSTMGYGEDNPVADNSTAAGRAQNRPVEVYMYASQAMIKAAEQQAN